MVNCRKLVMVLGLVGLVAACTQPAQNEFVVVETTKADPE